MIMRLFSIFDEKVGSYSNPFCANAIGEAIRMFGDLVLDDKSRIFKHPGDFQLFHIGEFNLESGKLIQESQPVYLSRGNDFVGPEAVLRGVPSEG